MKAMSEYLRSSYPSCEQSVIIGAANVNLWSHTGKHSTLLDLGRSCNPYSKNTVVNLQWPTDTPLVLCISPPSILLYCRTAHIVGVIAKSWWVKRRVEERLFKRSNPTHATDSQVWRLKGLWYKRGFTAQRGSPGILCFGMIWPQMKCFVWT